jgi:very-long-chain (3R)-3-hydroxyacyl-CoA dehydratase
VHAIVRLVPSPVGTTALQVFVAPAAGQRGLFLPVAQRTGSRKLMFGAWALVEVVRYSYYALQLVGAPIPFAFTWLRYSIFLFDYPLGVSGELGTLYVSIDALAAVHPALFYATIAIMLSYLPGLPIMYSSCSRSVASTSRLMVLLIVQKRARRTPKARSKKAE